MDEREFVTRAEDELSSLDEALAALERDDVDWQLSDGVLTLEFEGRGKIIVSVNRPARELWVAAASQGLHFGLGEDGRWRTGKGQELRATLSAFVSEKLGDAVNL